MTQKELQKEYDKHINKFDTIKEEVEKKIVNTENYKGVFYETTPFSYQRGGFRRGKLVQNMNRIKSTNNLYTYGFDAENNIVEVREGIEIRDAFYYEFFFYNEGKLVKSLAFNNGKTLQNIRYYLYSEDNLLTKMFSKGRMGGREEEYHYDKERHLEEITIRQFDGNGNEGGTLFHLFEYNSDGSLKSITKSALGNTDYKDIIYSSNAK